MSVSSKAAAATASMVCRLIARILCKLKPALRSDTMQECTRATAAGRPEAES
jgi:hypothetical protein